MLLCLCCQHWDQCHFAPVCEWHVGGGGGLEESQEEGKEEGEKRVGIMEEKGREGDMCRVRGEKREGEGRERRRGEGRAEWVGEMGGGVD